MKKQTIIQLLVFMWLFSLPILAQKKEKHDYLVTIQTDWGNMWLLLYEQTPLHKQNFLKLIESRFYDNLLFHRIIENFMIQGGDPISKNASTEQRLGNGGDDLPRIPAEFVPELFHKKGVLAAARDSNPDKASSACQFYIVQGKTWDDTALENLMKRSGKAYSEEQKQAYKTIGGTPHLDGNYTVFGQVISGLAIVDSIAKQPKDRFDRPIKDIRFTITAEKLKKKKITTLTGYVFAQ